MSNGQNVRHHKPCKFEWSDSFALDYEQNGIPLESKWKKSLRSYSFNLKGKIFLRVQYPRLHKPRKFERSWRLIRYWFTQSELPEEIRARTFSDSQNFFWFRALLGPLGTIFLHDVGRVSREGVLIGFRWCQKTPASRIIVVRLIVAEIAVHPAIFHVYSSAVSREFPGCLLVCCTQCRV